MMPRFSRWDGSAILVDDDGEQVAGKSVPIERERNRKRKYKSQISVISNFAILGRGWEEKRDLLSGD